jgi:ABC-type phosphate transport system permease subunit
MDERNEKRHLLRLVRGLIWTLLSIPAAYALLYGVLIRQLGAFATLIFMAWLVIAAVVIPVCVLVRLFISNASADSKRPPRSESQPDPATDSE